MKLLVLILFWAPFHVFAAEQGGLSFKGIQRSLIDWERVHPYHWMDLDLWREDLAEREANPQYEALVKNRMVKEKVGKVLQCVGECLNFRGKAFNHLKFNSILREGDEIQTDPNSYLWIFLFDGTMVRLSPSTSISFLEINVGKSEIFHHARINYGNVLWLSRDTRPMLEDNIRETDTLFLPLNFLEANKKNGLKSVREGELDKYLEEDMSNLNHAKKLNQLIQENNLFIDDKPSYAFIVLPNATVFGGSLKMEFVVLDGGASFFKKRSSKQLRIKTGEIKEEDEYLDMPTTLFYRGFKNKDVSSIDEDFWYQIDPNGLVLGRSSEKNGAEYAMGEFITSRITSILVARELLLRQNSYVIFDSDIDENTFAADYGYRLWGSLTAMPKEDLRKRFEFLQEYTRRIETTNLLEREKFKQQRALYGEEFVTQPFSNRFYIRALKDYYFDKLKLTRIKDDREVLNSTSHPYWIRVRHKED